MTRHRLILAALIGVLALVCVAGLMDSPSGDTRLSILPPSDWHLYKKEIAGNLSGSVEIITIGPLEISTQRRFFD
jgi:hypothetical protein